MDALKAIHARRSIRRYLDKPVSEGELNILLKAAMAAPSAGNARPWEFVVVTRRELLEAVGEFHPYAKMAAEAPAAILICGDPAREKYAGYWPQDCAAATQNLLIAATAQGLGAVWTGVHPDEPRVEGFRKLLDVPGNVVPFAFVVLGWPGEDKAPADRFDQTRVHADVW